MSPEVIALIGLIRSITPELVGLIDDLGSLAEGGEISTERLLQLQERGNDVSQGLSDLIAQRQEEEG